MQWETPKSIDLVLLQYLLHRSGSRTGLVAMAELQAR